MMMMKLCLLFAVIALAFCEMSWFALNGVSEETGIALCTGMDVRSNYDDLVLIVGDETDYKNLVSVYPQAMILAPYSHQQMIIVSNPEGEVPDVLDGYRITSSKVVLAQTEKVQLWVQTVGSRMEINYVATKKISIPPPIDSQYQTVVHNDKIQSLIDSISESNLRAQQEKITGFFTRVSTSAEIREAQKYIEAEFRSNGATVSTETFRENMSDNVIAKFAGVENPEKIVIIGAHYDSIPSRGRAPGADDNGSGTCSILEQVRALHASGLKFKYSVWFMTFSGEEQGLIGSTFSARKYKQEGLDIVAMINGDMLGYNTDSNPKIGVKHQMVTESLRNLCIKTTQTYLPQKDIGDSSGTGSDWRPFYQEGFAAFGFFEADKIAANNPYYHKATDTSSTLNFPHYRDVSAAVLACAATVAIPAN